MKVIIFETDILILAKLEIFLRRKGINSFAIHSADDLNLVIENGCCIIFNFQEYKTILNLEKDFTCSYIYYKIYRKPRGIKMKAKNNFVKSSKFKVLKLLNYLELLAIENELDLFKDNICYVASNEQKYYFNEILFDKIPKTLYKVLLEIQKHPEGVTVEELNKKVFKNTKINLNSMQVQISNLRKALNSIPNYKYKIVFKDKKYKIMEEKLLQD